MRKMITSKVLLLTALPLLLWGCGQADDNSEMMSALTEKPDGKRSGGPLRFLEKALKKLDLSAEQRAALDALKANTREKAAPLRTAATAAAKELAHQVKLGAIDQVKLERQVAQLKTASEQVRPAITQAINTLHHTLTPAQRQQLVSALKKKHEKRRWGHRHHKMKKIAKKLGLSEDQLDRLKEVMMSSFKGHRSEMKGHHKQHREQLRAAAEAFKSESFDAGSFQIFEGPMARFQPHLQRFTAIAGKVLPLLTPAQREKLAELIEKRAARMME